ncbi:MAG: inositol monophosphatase [Rhodospirillaceae bacterium]|nr:inositol monophosphatase [Rhodospirillaceae bacterium]MBT6140239.1 inositol monophosphatase [Rhodospirillaceae bacterium]
MAGRSPLINVVTKACYKVSRRLLRDFGEVEQLQVSKKGPADFVSTADTNAERALVSELKSARPEYGFLLEEGNEIESRDPDGRRWIIDPLDGTLNFLHGIPHFCISIALEERGQVIAGVIYEPIRDEMYWAEKGDGAYLNDRRIRVSGRSQMNEAVFATGIPFMGRDGHELFLKQLESVMGSCAGVRRQGAAALDLAYVASGRYEGFWEKGVHPWDIAAGMLLVTEAGGMVSDYNGQNRMMEKGEVVAVNNRLHTPFQRMLRRATK